MIKNDLETYASPQCRVLTVKVSSVLCDSVNGNSPTITYNDDLFDLS